MDMIRPLVLILALAAPLPALAHNVISSVFPSGTDIEGEVGFSNGEMASDLTIEVFDEAGNKLGETVTDADGFFIYTPTQPITHIFKGDLGAGHVAEITMPAAEVAELMGQDAAESSAAASVLTGAPAAVTTPAAAGLTDETRAEFAKMLRTELRPIRQELTALKSETNFQSVLGGIGYIVGLFGLGFYIAARRKMEGKA
jgi:nickel transport protein